MPSDVTNMASIGYDGKKLPSLVLLLNGRAVIICLSLISVVLVPTDPLVFTAELMLCITTRFHALLLALEQKTSQKKPGKI
ncbi:hypothetical protein KUTeg_001553 [Tegillarca granosa]|uniref:Uncharacterized protein n=1 Tax=Tegillarca granosa TaxID=220873 RepID=A0ABQ9FTA0_TEGGR|nr:hypothetical protein KUTeg_001553 [Tegillarca granosa]